MMTMISTPLSPITRKSPARLVDSFRVKDIIMLYQQDFDMNVERFFRGMDTIQLYECPDTGYRFYYPFTLAGDGDFYQELLLAKKRIKQAFYKPLRFEHNFALTRIGQHESVLDIGCGEGFFLEQLKDRTTKLYGLEMYDLALQMCKEKGIDARKEFIEGHETGKSELYDVVTAFQVLEHVHDINSFISNAVRVLKKNGRLFISVPNNNPWFQRFNKHSTLNLPPHHMGLWNEKAFRKTADFFGLTINNIGFDEHLTWKLDAYYRAKCWLGIIPGVNKLSFSEKLKLTLVSPGAALSSLADFAFTRIQGYNIVVEFTKR